MTPLLLLLLSADGGALEPLVEVSARVPDAVVDLRYATADNFMGKAVYPKDARCLLLARAAERLARAAGALREQGFRLKLYDCYRPRSVQAELWKVMPRPGYVADPKTGSHHSRGGAVDLTLVTLDGGAVEMPTGYDTFGKAARHGSSAGTEASRQNRETLRQAMEAAGFKRINSEWWHYELPDAAQAPLRDEPFGGAREGGR